MLNETNDQLQGVGLPSNDSRTVDRAVENIYALFGRSTTLIPIPRSDVAAQLPHATTLAQSLQPEFQAALRTSNVAVQCGRESGNLYAINFSRQVDYGAFLAINPKLRNSIAVKYELGVVIFIRVPGPMPPTIRTDSCTWLSEGFIIPVYNRENPKAITVFSPHPPVELGFDEISWNADLTMGFKRFATAAIYGAPFETDKKGRATLNAMHWAALFQTDTAIVYRADAQQFRLWEKPGSVRPVSDMEISKLILDFVFKWRGNAPATAISESSINKCLEALKIIAVDRNEHPTGPEDLERFLGENVEACDAADVTSEELYSCYRTWSKASNVIPLAGRQFYTTLPGCIAKLFGVGKNHCIEREGRERRGYSGLRFKVAKASQDA